MKSPSGNYLKLVSAILLTVYFVINFTGCSNSILDTMPNYTAPVQSTQSKSNTAATSQMPKGVVKVSDLPVEARKTMLLIKSGGPFPYTQDGAVFNNYEGLLPGKSSGYYHEYTVITPGSPDRGARRIVAGSNGEHYYTDDHYNSFKLVVE
jgi:ribonuclease T1